MHTPVPAGMSWRRATFSDTGENCVELAWGEGHAYVRDSKNAPGPVLRINPKALLKAIGSARAGSLDH